MKFEDLNFSRKIQIKVDFFPSLYCEGSEIGVWGESDETPIEVLVGLLLDYDIDLGILFTEDEINVALVMDNKEVTIYSKAREEVKEREVEEVILASGLDKVILAEEIMDYGQLGIRILSNKKIEVDEGEEN